MAILESHVLTRHFGALTAVDALTLSADTGEVFGEVFTRVRAIPTGNVL
jgi:ABC-type branched-subunit amino acid transport system ATPase component